jgi:hypothetical protein
VIRAYRYVAIEKEGAAPKYLTIYEMKIIVAHMVNISYMGTKLNKYFRAEL